VASQSALFIKKTIKSRKKGKHEFSTYYDIKELIEK
jgi:hypothetical protein